MLVENMFELIMIGLALTHSRFARLPLMVVGNIILFAVITMLIEKYTDVSVTPGYEIYYGIGGLYFLLMGSAFRAGKTKIYSAISIILFIEAGASGSMLIHDSFAPWHEWINDKALVIECICVWLSSLATSTGRRRGD